MAMLASLLEVVLRRSASRSSIVLKDIYQGFNYKQRLDRAYAPKVRKFSTAQNHEQLSTDEKAAELTTALFPNWKYYLAIASPGILALIWGTWIVNDKKVKEKSEALAPQFVDLVRTYHGFPEEDRVLDECRKKILLTQQLSYDVSIELSSGERFTFQIPGTMVVSEAEKLIRSKLVELSKIFTHNRITYSLSIEVSDLSLVPYQSFEDAKNEIELKKVSKHAHSGAQGFNNSCWDKSSSKANVQYSVADIEEFLKSELLFSKAFPFYRKEFLVLRVAQSPVDFIVSGISLFTSKSSKNLDYITKNGRRNKVSSLNQRDEVKQAIAELEREIKGIETERDIGYRTTDTIDGDINRLRSQITLLKRKYLNYFYYF